MKTILCFTALFAAAYASGQFSVLHSSKALEFKGEDLLQSDAISDVLAASLGYSVEQNNNWNGLYIKNPFETPRAVVALLIDGIEKVHVEPSKAHTFNLVGSSTSESLDSFASRVEEHHSVAIDIDLKSGLNALTPFSNIFGETKPSIAEKSASSLKPNLHADDKIFLEQIAIINAIADNLPSVKSLPSLITIRLSLNELVATHSLSSPSITDALKLLSAATEKLSNAAKKAYHNDALIVVLTTKYENNPIRTKRAAGETKQEAALDPTKMNLAESYSEDYPVIFNIMLWFGVVFVFSLLAITVAIASMDPGRDSIIYRMTSNRMKKEN